MTQTYRNLEILVCDDGSTDGSVEILKRLASEDKRIKVFQNTENLKIVKTLNKLISLSQGKYIARMDSDDVSLPERIERQVKFLEKNKHIMICGSRITQIDENGNFIKNPILPVTKYEVKKYRLFGCPFCHPTIMIRSDVLKEYKYLADFEYAEDIELWLRILENYDGINLRKRLLKYRIHKKQISFEKIDSQIAVMEKVYKKHNFGVIEGESAFSYAKFIVKKKRDKFVFKILLSLIVKFNVFLHPKILLMALYRFIRSEKC